MNFSKTLILILIGASFLFIGCKKEVKVPNNKLDSSAEQTVQPVKQIEESKDNDFLTEEDIILKKFKATNYFSFPVEGIESTTPKNINPTDTINVTDSKSYNDTIDVIYTDDPTVEYISREFWMELPTEIKNFSVENLQRSIIKKASFGKCSTFDDFKLELSECEEPNAQKIKAIPYDSESNTMVNAEEKKITFESIFQNIISFKFSDYEMPASASKSLETERYLNYDLNNDIEISIDNIIIPVKKKELRKLLVKKIKESQNSTELDDLPLNNFFIQNDKVTFVFNNREISSDSEDMIRIDISYDELEPLLNEYGKLILFPPKVQITEK